jgi:hypothetical protein
MYLVTPAYAAFAAAAQAAARAGLKQTSDGFGDICVSKSERLCRCGCLMEAALSLAAAAAAQSSTTLAEASK